MGSFSRYKWCEGTNCCNNIYIMTYSIKYAVQLKHWWKHNLPNLLYRANSTKISKASWLHPSHLEDICTNQHVQRALIYISGDQLTTDHTYLRLYLKISEKREGTNWCSNIACWRKCFLFTPVYWDKNLSVIPSILVPVQALRGSSRYELTLQTFYLSHSETYQNVQIKIN